MDKIEYGLAMLAMQGYIVVSRHFKFLLHIPLPILPCPGLLLKTQDDEYGGWVGGGQGG